MSRYKAGIMKPGFNPLGTQTGPGYYNALYGWGYGVNGELGLGTIINRSSPTQVGTLTDWSSIASSSVVLAIKSDGTLWVWGNDATGSYGQSGLNSPSQRSSPVQVGSLTNWSSVSAGDNHSAAIKTDGTLWTWGYNWYGQLGLGDSGDYTNRSSPVQVGALTTWASVFGGSNQTSAIKSDGTLWGWGENLQGALGLGDTVRRSTPSPIGALTNWASVSTGYAYMASIKTDGTLWTWGYNNYGQLGQGDVINRSSPVQVGSLTNWYKVSAACGGSTSFAIKTDGTLWVWGYNNQGQLGQNDTTNRSSPVQVGSLTNWSSVSASSNHTVAIKTDGTLWTWGRNNNGELGQNNVVNRSSPVQVGALTTWTTIFNSNYSLNTFAMQ
jgi:alpha-tubulin suppressor-like RCC1 family protein